MSYDTAETEKSVSVSESMLVTGPGLSQSLMIMSMCETLDVMRQRTLTTQLKSWASFCSAILVQSFNHWCSIQ